MIVADAPPGAERRAADRIATVPPRTARHWAAFVALCLMLVAYTKGPVFWARLDLAVLTGFLLDDVWVQLAFLVPTAFVLAIAAPAVLTLWSDRLVVVTFALFVLVVLASSLWSVTPQQTLEQTTMFVLSTAAALLAGAYLRRFDALAALWLAMQVGVFASLFAWHREWPGIFVGFRGDQFAGVFLNKNSLGPVAMTGVMTSAVLGIAAWRRQVWWLVPLTLVTLLVDTVIWYWSNSLTAMFAWLAAIASVGVLALLVPGPRTVMRRIAGAISIVLVGLAVAAAVAFRHELSERLGRQEFLSGRVAIWDVVFDYIRERPVRGWGYMSLWTQPEIFASQRAARLNPVYEAHSGYLEILLGVGLIGLALLIVVCVVALVRVVRAMWFLSNVVAAWSVAMVVYTVVVNLTETFVGPNLLPWAMLCLATGQAVAVMHRASVGAPTAPAFAASGPVLDPAGGDPDPTVLRSEAAVPTSASTEPAPDDATPAATEWFDFSFDTHDGEVGRTRRSPAVGPDGSAGAFDDPGPGGPSGNGHGFRFDDFDDFDDWDDEPAADARPDGR